MTDGQTELALSTLRFLNSRMSVSSKVVRTDAQVVAEALDESGFTISDLIELYIERVRKTS